MISLLDVVLPSSGKASRDARFWRSRRVWGRDGCAERRRKPRLEPDVRSSRIVIEHEIPNATPFRVATFTRTILPFHKMPNTTPIGLFPTTTLNRKKGVLLHDQTTAVERFCLVSFVDVDPPCAKHNLVAGTTPSSRKTEISSALAFSTSVLLSSLSLVSSM